MPVFPRILPSYKWILGVHDRPRTSCITLAVPNVILALFPRMLSVLQLVAFVSIDARCLTAISLSLYPLPMLIQMTSTPGLSHKKCFRILIYKCDATSSGMEWNRWKVLVVSSRNNKLTSLLCHVALMKLKNLEKGLTKSLDPAMFRIISIQMSSRMTAGEFWSYWLQYLAFFAIFRNFLFILFLIAAIKSNVVEWKPDPELDFGMFFIMPDLFLPLSRRRKRKSGGKISKMAPFDLDEFLPENAFLDFKKVYILIWTPIPL